MEASSPRRLIAPGSVRAVRLHVLRGLYTTCVSRLRENRTGEVETTGFYLTLNPFPSLLNCALVRSRSRALDSDRMSSEATTSSWLATYMAARAPITVVTPELSDSSRRSAEPRSPALPAAERELALRTSGGTGRPQPEPTSSYALRLIVSGPCWWSERMVLLSRRLKMSLFLNTSS